MATSIYNTYPISLIDGRTIFVSPVKIKYLREFMDQFELIKNAKDDDETIKILVDLARILMQEFDVEISKSSESMEEYLDLPTVYKILDYCANIKLNEKSDESVTKQAVDNNNTWENLDLAKLESEVFVLGIWKSYKEMEESISMPELMATLSTKRDLDYAEKKFLAAMQGVDLEDGKKEDAWEEMKKRVLYKGKDSNDITNLRGRKAQAAGFGIGMGLDYEEVIG
jgi:hypothetical protein